MPNPKQRRQNRRNGVRCDKKADRQKGVSAIGRALQEHLSTDQVAAGSLKRVPVNTLK